MRRPILVFLLALLPALACAQPSPVFTAPTFVDPATTRINLGLGTMATQGANAVAITGGAIAGVSTIWNSAAPTTPAAINLAGANPNPVISLGLTVTGTWPAGVAPYNKMFVLDNSDHRNAGNASPVLLLSAASGGANSYGFSEALSVSCNTQGTVGIDGRPAGTNFMTCLEGRSAPSNNAGGVSMSTPVGQNNPMNLYAILSPGATWWQNNETFEMDYETMYGASALMQVAGQLARLSQDFGTVGTGHGPTQMAGRHGIWVSSQAPSVDGTSSASAAASAGNNLPPLLDMLFSGGDSQEYPFDATTRLWQFIPQVYANSNACVSGVNNCTSNVAAAAMRPQIAGWGLDWGNVHFATDVIKSPNFEVKGTGETDIGNIRITGTTGGGTISLVGSYISGVTYVSEDQAVHQVGEYCYGSGVGTVPGAILAIAGVTSGVPNSFTVVDKGWSPNTAAVNNAAGTQTFICAGRVNVTLAWTDVTGGTTPVLNLAGSVQATGTLYAQGSLTTDNNVNIKNPGGNGGYGGLSPSGSNLTFKNYNGTVAAYYDLNATVPAFVFSAPAYLPHYTVAGLPPCNAGQQYSMAAVTDATAPTYNSTLTGGGAGVIPVFCNGTVWTAH